MSGQNTTAALALAAFALGGALAAPLDDCRWVPGQPAAGTNGTVYAATVWHPDGAAPAPGLLVVGGHFTVAGDVPALNIAAWNGSFWQPLGSGIQGPTSDMWFAVHALAVYNGELIAGGNFVTAGGVACSNVARWDGNSWQPLGSGTEGSVDALTVYGDELIAGGNFGTAGGVSCNSIARWDGSAWQPLGAGIGREPSLLGHVSSLTVYDGGLIAAGHFVTAGGLPCASIARWDGNVWQPLGTGISGGYPHTLVRAVVVYNGELVAGGQFTGAGGVGCAYVARWNGSAWQPLGSGIGGEPPYIEVRALTVYDDELIAGGGFGSAGGVACANIARWDGSAWRRVGGGRSGLVQAAAVYNGELIAGGSTGIPRNNYISRWNGSEWRPLSSVPRDSVYAVMRWPGTALLAGGSFTITEGVQCNNIAMWGDVWKPLASGVNGTVRALTILNDAPIAGGEFTAAGDVACSRIARWHGSVWEALGSGMDGVVYALTVKDGLLIAGGAFATAGGVTCNGIASWNGSTWEPLGSGLDGTVCALTVYNGDLIAGGSFNTAGGVACSRIARWNGTTWQPLGAGMSGDVLALGDYNGELIVGGAFAVAGTVTCNYIARWDGSAWHALGSGTSGSVRALATCDTGLFAAGEFGFAGGAPCNFVAQWDGGAWQTLGEGVNDNVYALATGYCAAEGDSLAVGGRFSAAGGQSSAPWARWDCTHYGACCLPDGTCQDVTLNQCHWHNGAWTGGTDCAAFTCPEPPPAPVANAGPDQNVAGPAAGETTVLVTLDGSASTGTELLYEWSEGGTVLSGDMVAQVTLAVGTHEITLTVVDDQGRTSTDGVVVVVRAAERRWTLTLHLNGRGEVRVNGELQLASVDDITEVSLEFGDGAWVALAAATVGKCDEFVGWTGGLVSSLPEETVVMDGDKEITAEFREGIIRTDACCGADCALTMALAYLGYGAFSGRRRSSNR